MKMKLTLSAMMLIASTALVKAQVKKPVNWDFKVVKIEDDTATLCFKATLDPGWHIYSQFMEKGGPKPTSFTFDPSESFELIGTMQEESPVIKEYSDVFLMEMAWFEKEAVFTQKISLKEPSVTVRGIVEFRACTDIECLLPEEKEFSFNLKREVDKNSLKSKNRSGKALGIFRLDKRPTVVLGWHRFASLLKRSTGYRYITKMDDIKLTTKH